MDMTDSLAPRSDQMNSADLLTGPRTFTIKDVREGNAEQPFWFYLAEFPDGRPFKPSKTVRRIMVKVWQSTNPTDFIGNRFTLYTDESVRFGGQSVGGIRIKAMSGIQGTQKVTLPESKGKVKTHVIEALPDDAPSSPAVSESDVRIAELRAEWDAASEERREQIKAEVAALQGSQS
jgi:hypothetical protein